MIAVSPLSGSKNSTVFTFSINPELVSPTINWGDGTFSYTNTATHVYTNNGIYNIHGGDCASTSAFQVSVNNFPFLNDRLEIGAENLSSYTSCPGTFNINLTSVNDINTVILYSSGSMSPPYSDDVTFWSHLNPKWCFYNNGTPVNEIVLSGSPILSGTTILGYSATSVITYSDDMPGNPRLFFTLKKDEVGTPINSRVYATVNHSICACVPDKLIVTSDGIKPLDGIRWADMDIPYIISVGSSQNSCTNILHYVSGYTTEIRFISDCYGLPDSAFVKPLCAMPLVDNNCFPVGGYILSNFKLPSSSLPAPVTTNNSNSCNYDPSKVEFLSKTNSPRSVSISAIGKFSYNSIEYTLSGESDKFNIYKFENRHAFYRKGEDQNIYTLLKPTLPFDVEEYENFNLYLSAVAGEGDTLGKTYDKIQNFAKDHSDIDLCTVDALINKSTMFDSEIEDFDLEYPEELRRIFDFTTIPLQKLIGTRCVCNTNFVGCQGCKNTNICTICKFDKRSNLGSMITQNDYITAGTTILYKETGSDVFQFFPVPQLRSITVSENYTELQTNDNFSIMTNDNQILVLNAETFISSITAIADVYKLRFLEDPNVNNIGWQNICFYSWDNSPQNNPIESVVNYMDTRNMLNPSISSNEDWYGDNGVLDEIFSFILTKNLINS